MIMINRQVEACRFFTEQSKRIKGFTLKGYSDII